MEAAEERGLASDSLEAFWLEFDHAARDFEQRGSSRPEVPLQALKTGLQRRLYGSGIDGSGSERPLLPSQGGTGKAGGRGKSSRFGSPPGLGGAAPGTVKAPRSLGFLPGCTIVAPSPPFTSCFSLKSATIRKADK